MHQFPGVFLHVNPRDADLFAGVAHLDMDKSVLGDGKFVLGNLIALGQIRIKIVLAGKPAFPVDLAVGGHGHAQGKVHHLFVEHRQYARHPQTNRAGVRVGGRTEFGGATAEYLGSGFQLGMNFQADDGFKMHNVSCSLVIFITKARKGKNTKKNLEIDCFQLISEKFCHTAELQKKIF